MQNRAAQRVDWLDAAKGIAILLVVIGHCFRDEMRLVSQPCELVYQFVYCIHMPIFFCVSGYLYGAKKERYMQTPLLSFLGHRAKLLLLPFLTVSLLIYLIYFLAARLPGVGGMLQAPMGLGAYLGLALTGNNPYAFHLWYLLALFLISVLAHLLCKALAKIKHHEALIFGCSLIAWLCWAIGGDLPITICNAVIKYWVYFMTGMMLRQVKYRPAPVVGWSAFAAATAYLTYFALNRGVGTETWRPWSYLGLLLSVLAMVWGVFTLSKGAKGRLRTALCFLGRNSYTIYLLHQPFFCGFVGMALYTKMGMPILPVLVICFVLSLAAPFLIAQVLSKIKPLARITKTLMNIP